MLVELENTNFDDYEYIIAGSGPAGLSLALGLKKNTKKKVLIIEAGSFEYDKESQEYYKGTLDNNCGLKELDASRVRAFGGTSMVWGGMCRPLDNIDFQSWPIKKNELDPFLNDAYKFLNVEKPIKKDLNLNDNFNLIDFKWSEPKLRINEDYKDNLIKDDQIDLLIETSVVNIDGTSQIDNIELYNNKSKKYLLIKPKIFILACGAIENSRILLTSQYKSKKTFLKELEIGTYYQIHPKYVVGKTIITMDDLKKKLNLDYYNNPRNAYFIAPTKKLITETNIGNVGLRILINEYSKSSKKLLKDLFCVAPKYAEKISSLIYKKIDCANLRFLCSWEVKPSKKNRISLNLLDLDAHNNPRAKLTMNLDVDEKRTIRIFMEQFGKYFIDEDIGRIAIKEFYYNDKNEWDESGFGGSHQMGGTKMGFSPKDSVVNTNLKVHNVNNFYVLGTSVFNSSGHANPTLTICQLSFRLANHLKKII